MKPGWESGDSLKETQEVDPHRPLDPLHRALEKPGLALHLALVLIPGLERLVPDRWKQGLLLQARGRCLRV